MGSRSICRVGKPYLAGLLLTVMGASLPSAVPAQEKRYMPTWESLDSRPNPGWFDEAKFGIFIHWGVYSVPAWAPKGRYAEWYWNALQDRNGETWKFHEKTYGAGWKYQDFAPQFRAELFDPAQWADLFARAGAKYVVLTSKHHDGFCLWPSAQSWNWNSVDVGPHRDLLGDLTNAVRDKGLKMGLYYSLYEWYHPLYQSDPKQYVAAHMLPQLKDVVTRYKPSLIFADGEWEHPSELWRSAEFLAWLFNESPVKGEVVVDDRWGKETRSKHGGYFTTEYGDVGGNASLAAGRKWEECRGIGASFGYNRNEDAWDYKSAPELIRLLVELVSKGGNLLLDVGPTADGRIPAIQQQRLLDMGAWLQANGEAIYGTKPWRVANEGKNLWYTRKNGEVYAICFDWPQGELALDAPKPGKNATVTLLGNPAPLRWKQENGKMRVALPPAPPQTPLARAAYVFKLTGVE